MGRQYGRIRPRCMASLPLLPPPPPPACRRLAAPSLTTLPPQVASAVSRACQVPRAAAVVQRAAQLQSVARISGAASLRRQQGAGMGAAARLSVVRAMATANGPVTKKVRAMIGVLHGMGLQRWTHACVREEPIP